MSHLSYRAMRCIIPTVALALIAFQQPLSAHRPVFTEDEATGEKKGAGMGLSVARSIIEAHKGSVGYSVENNNSVFTALLPVLHK